MTPAAELRAAADHLDELAGAATPGPWFVECSHGDPACQLHLVSDVMRDKYGTNSVSTDDHGTAAYIAAMHPGVAKALAAWLRVADDRHPRLTDPDGDAMCQGCIERGAHVLSWPCDELEPALAVARALNAASP